MSSCPCRILVSGVRKPITYINVATRFLDAHGEVHLSALGSAIAGMVTVAEILKSRQLAVVSRLRTSLEDRMVDNRQAYILSRPTLSEPSVAMIQGLSGLPHPAGRSGHHLLLHAQAHEYLQNGHRSEEISSIRRSHWQTRQGRDRRP